MAKVVGPLHSSEARGSVGSLTYNTWRGISIVKARAGPTTQDSAAQVAIRAKTAIATAAWQALTDAQRDAWRDYAASHTDIDWTGNPQRITGYNWYVRIQVRRQILGYVPSPSLPRYPVVYSLTNFAVAQNGADLRATWTPLPWIPLFSSMIEFYIAGPFSAGRHPNIQQADRKAHALEMVGNYSWTPPAVGWYTVFPRPLSMEGLVGTFLRARTEIT